MSKTKSTESVHHGERGGGAFDASGAPHRTACRLFPGFASLPTPVLVSLERYAHLFERDGSPLADGDRAAIASAVAAVVAGGPAPDGHDLGDGTRRTTALARFATRLVARCFMVDAGDLARLSRAGLTPDEVAAAAESALAFHVVARLVRACRAAPGARSCGRMKLGDDVRAA